jgi:anaerobic magnesium-protoporphyrin IX monomethyl ester cyclase
MINSPKVLLTHAYYLSEDEKELKIMKPYPPLGILYLAAFLEQKNIKTDVVDSTFIDFKKQLELIIDYSPDYIGIYTNLMTKVNVIKLIAALKNEPKLSKTKIILGGPEVKFNSKNFHANGAEFIVKGEGEETFFELIVNLSLDKDLGNIDGLSYLKNGRIIENQDRKKLIEIDCLPFPAREKINLNLYFNAWKQKHGASTISVSTMRGCPYTCKWCSRAVYGKSYRRKNVKFVVDEIQEIQQKYNFDTIWFVDDVFTVSHKWLLEFKNEVVSRRVKIKYECITRADRMSMEVIQLLKESGCYRVWIGAESGSQKVIDLMDRRVDVNQVREMIIETRKNGIEAGTFTMLGYPGETEEDIIETLNHLKISNPDYFTITTAYPIKGTELYIENENEFMNSPDWATSSDRDIKLNTAYSKKYYQYAVSWINNEMKLLKLKNQQMQLSRMEFFKLLIKSKLSRNLMRMYK